MHIVTLLYKVLRYLQSLSLRGTHLFVIFYFGGVMFKHFKIGTALALMLSLCACDENKNNNQQAQMQAPQVETVQVLPQNVPLAFEFAARAQGSKETEVRARVGGILLKRNYVEGAEVKEGSVLFQIDPKPYEVALKQAQAKLAQIQAELKNAETQLARTEKLFKQGYASEKTRDEAVANADSLKASLQLAEAEVDAAQLNLDYTTVTAPISGKTSMEAQSEGSLISTTGDAGLLTHITQLDPIYVIFSVSENELMALTNMVESGKILNPYNSKDIVAKLKLGDDSLYEEDGKIDFITPNIDRATGTAKLRAVFANPQKKLRPGQFLRLVMEGLTRIDAIIVPQTAVMQGANGAYVYRVNPQNVVEMVSVNTGLSTKDGGWIIDTGLQANDKVVISGLLKVRPGMTVAPVVVNANEPAAGNPAVKGYVKPVVEQPQAENVPNSIEQVQDEAQALISDEVATEVVNNADNAQETATSAQAQ